MGKNKIRTLAIRKIKKSFRRFLSLAVLSLLGVTVFVGIKMSNPDMMESLDRYYDKNNVYDIKVISTLGLTNTDLATIANIDENINVYGSRSKDMEFHKDNQSSVIKILEITEDVNNIAIKEGRMPKNKDEVIIESGIKNKFGLKIGEKINLDISEDDTTINSKELTLVGTVVSPIYVLNSNGNINRGNTNLGVGDVDFYGYTIPEFFNMDYYTEIYITVKNDLKTNSDEYNKSIDNVISEIDKIKQTREIARKDEFVKIANESLDKKGKDGLKQFSDIKEQLEKANTELQSGKKELETSETELNNAKNKLNKAKEEIDTGNDKIQKGEEELEKAKKELDRLKKEVEKEVSKYNLTYEDVCLIIEVINGRNITKEEAIDLLPTNVKYYDQIVEIINYMYENKCEKALKNYINDVNKQELINKIPKNIKNYDKVIQYIESWDTAKIRKRIISYFLNEDYIEEIKSKIPTSAQNYNNIINALDDYKAMAKKMKELYNGVEKIQSGYETYQKNVELLESKKKEIVQGTEDYTNALEKYDNGMQEYNNGKKLYNDNLNIYNSKIEEYNVNFNKFNEQIQKARKEINSIESAKWYIYNRMDNSEYSSYIDSSDSVERLAAIFPTIFFAVAIFISSLSMARMAIEDRGEIGTLKSLGYGNMSIRSIYILYATLATLFGGILRSNSRILHASKNNF